MRNRRKTHLLQIRVGPIFLATQCSVRNAHCRNQSREESSVTYPPVVPPTLALALALALTKIDKTIVSSHFPPPTKSKHDNHQLTHRKIRSWLVVVRVCGGSPRTWPRKLQDFCVTCWWWSSNTSSPSSSGGLGRCSRWLIGTNPSYRMQNAATRCAVLIVQRTTAVMLVVAHSLRILFKARPASRRSASSLRLARHNRSAG
jgi:hypothetical protein